MSDNANIVIAPRLFSPDVFYNAVTPAGSTISHIVGPNPMDGTQVMVNDQVIPRGLWDKYQVKDHDLIVVSIFPAGGDGGKNVLRVVLMVVVAVFAAYMGAGVAGLYSNMAGAMVSGAITMAGGLAVNALIPPQSATLAQGQTAIEQPAQSFSITSGENAYRHYGAVQKLYGFVRYAPSFGANGYTEVIGDDQYVNLLFCLGYAPMNISDIQIGDVGIESYEGVSYEVGNIEEINIYKNGVEEAPQNIRLCSTEYYVGSVLQDANPAHEGISTELIRAVEDDVTDRTVSIDFEFPQGLRSLSAEGSSSYASVDIEILAKHESTSIEEEFHNLFEKTDDQTGYTLIVNPALYPIGIYSHTFWGTDYYTLSRNFVFKNGVDILIYSGVSGWTEIPEDTELYNQMAAAYSAYESHSRTNDYFSFFMTSNNLEQLYDFTDGGETYLNIGKYNTRYSNPYFSWMGYLSSYFGRFLTTVNDTYGGGRNVDGTPYTYLQLFAADADEIFKDGSIWYNTANQKLQYLDTSLSGFVPISSYVYRAASPDVFGTVVRKTFSDNITNPQRKNVSFELQTPTAGFEIKIVSRRTTTGYGKYVFADFYVTTIRSIKKEAPVFDTDHNFQFLAMKIKATNQLMGAVNNVTVMGKSCLPIYDGTDWIDPVLEDGVWTQETDNPAWVYTDILHGPQVTNKVPYSQINVEKIKEWADINTADSIAYNNVHDGGLTMLDYLQMVSTTGRGQWSVSDSFFSIILDTEQTVPHQLISPRNSWGFSASKTFIKAPHALKVKYINPDNWQQDIVVVYNDGYDITNTTEFEELVTVGVTSADQAYKDGRYFFAAAKLRPEIYSVSMDFENLVARRGDLVTLVHDVLLVGSGAGRIREITDLRTIVVDEDFLFEDGKTYAVRVRKDDNTQIVIPIDMTAGIYNEIILSADATGAKVGDLVTYGETGKESIDVKIKEIEYNPDLSATLTLIDAAPDIHLADQGEIPAYEPNVTTPIDVTTLLPAPPEFREIEGGSFFDDGSIKKQLYINYLLPYDNKVPIKEVILFYRIHLGGEYAPTAWRSDRKPLQDGGFVIEVTDICPNDQNWALEFTMASISAWGRVGYQSISKYVSQDDVEFVDIFSEVYVSNFVISQTADGFGFTWDSVADVGAVGYLLKDVTDPLNEITISVSADTNTKYMVWYAPGSYDFEVTPYNKNGVYGTPTITTAIIPTSSIAIENVTVAWGELGRTINWDITGIWKDLVVSSDLVVTSLGTFHSASKNRVSVLGYIAPGTIAYEIRLYSKYDGQLLLSYESSFVEPSDSVVLSDLDPAAGEKLDGVTDGADVTADELISDDTKIYLDISQQKLVFNNKATYATSTAGVFVGLDNGTYKVNIGNSTQFFKWSGANLSWAGVSASLTEAGLFTASNAVISGDITAETGTIGGWDLSANTLYSGSNIILDAVNKSIGIKSATWGTDGIQLQYNAGNPRAYIGNGSDRYFKFDGTNLSWKGLNAELTTGGQLSVQDILATGGKVGGWDLSDDKISATGIEFDSTLNRLYVYNGSNYVTISPAGIVGYDSSFGGTTFDIPTDGGSPKFANGVIESTEYIINTVSVIQTDETANRGLKIGNSTLTGHNSAGLKLLQFDYNGANEGNAYIGDYESGNSGLKYTHVDNLFQFRGDIAVESMYPLPSDENLVGYWSFDEGSGTVAVDGSGNGNDGAIGTGLAYVQGVAGKGLASASGSGVNCGDDSSLDFGLTDFSISLWVYYPNVGNPNWMLGKGQAYNSIGFSIACYNITTGDPVSTSLYLNDGTRYLVNAGSLARENWHHVVYTVNRTSGIASAYTKGALNATLDISALGDISNANDLKLLITEGSLFLGSMDEVRIYSKALTPQEIKALYLYPAGNKGGTISATQVKTGVIQSSTYTTAVGSKIDLDAGTISLGGSTSPDFSVTSAGILTCTGAIISGAVTITGGSGIANLTDAGGLAAQDRTDLDYADGADVTDYTSISLDAQTRADAAEAAAVVTADAYADGIVTEEEARAIADATAKANLAQVLAEAYADGIVTLEEERAIADAQAKADAAELAAKGYTEGWSDYGADVTGSNIALSVVDQGTLALLNEISKNELDTTVIEDGKIATGLVVANSIVAGTITAEKFMSTLYGDLNQAMSYVKTVLGAGDEYEEDLTDALLTAGSGGMDADTHDDYGVSVRIQTAVEWDDGGVWDTGTWDHPTNISGSWASASNDLGSLKTLQMALRYISVEDLEAATSVVVYGIYSTDNTNWGTNTGLDDNVWETFSMQNITGDVYKASGTLKTFRYFKFYIVLSTSDTSKRIILHTLTYLGNVVNVFGMTVNVAIASGGTSTALSGFNATPAITVTPVGTAPLVPVITAQSANNVTIKLYNMAGTAVSGSCNITMIGV